MGMIDKFSDYFANDIAIDLGTANTLVGLSSTNPPSLQSKSTIADSKIVS
jgi:actin-like ATPase involved in cell morphogenesis